MIFTGVLSAHDQQVRLVPHLVRDRQMTVQYVLRVHGVVHDNRHADDTGRHHRRRDDTADTTNTTDTTTTTAGRRDAAAAVAGRVALHRAGRRRGRRNRAGRRVLYTAGHGVYSKLEKKTVVLLNDEPALFSRPTRS